MLLRHCSEHRRDESRCTHGRGDGDGCTDGILLVRHGGRTAAPAFDRFTDFGLRQQRHVAADFAKRSADDAERAREMRETIAVRMP